MKQNSRYLAAGGLFAKLPLEAGCRDAAVVAIHLKAHVVGSAEEWLGGVGNHRHLEGHRGLRGQDVGCALQC